eukprot:scaffold17147_cov155-Isochrysis_galbana.AAC.2
MSASLSASLRADCGGALDRCVAIFGRADQHSAGAEGAPYRLSIEGYGDSGLNGHWLCLFGEEGPASLEREGAGDGLGDPVPRCGVKAWQRVRQAQRRPPPLIVSIKRAQAQPRQNFNVPPPDYRPNKQHEAKTPARDHRLNPPPPQTRMYPIDHELCIQRPTLPLSRFRADSLLCAFGQLRARDPSARGYGCAEGGKALERPEARGLRALLIPGLAELAVVIGPKRVTVAVRAKDGGMGNTEADLRFKGGGSGEQSGRRRDAGAVRVCRLVPMAKADVRCPEILLGTPALAAAPPGWSAGLMGRFGRAWEEGGMPKGGGKQAGCYIERG